MSDDRLAGVERLLSLHAEETRTRFDLLTEKIVGGFTAITDRLASMALDVGQLMNERVDNRRRLDEHGKRLDDQERRLAALETSKRPTRARRKR